MKYVVNIIRYDRKHYVWCCEQFGSEFTPDHQRWQLRFPSEWRFEREEDAALFALTWE